MCDKLTNPDNGCVLTTGTRTGETAVYLCDDGFTLKGEKKCKCGDNGEWDGTDPTCKSKFQIILYQYELHTLLRFI